MWGGVGAADEDEVPVGELVGFVVGLEDVWLRVGVVGVRFPVADVFWSWVACFKV